MAARLPSLYLRRAALELEDACLPWGSDAVRYSPEDLLPKSTYCQRVEKQQRQSREGQVLNKNKKKGRYLRLGNIAASAINDIFPSSREMRVH
ncbi:hypothetical protein EJB05_34217, partial [Eragrostis curvula]